MSEMRIRITEKANGWNHPMGMWWDNHIGEEFDVVRIEDGIPRQYVVRVGHIECIGGTTRAFVPVTYAEEITP